MPERVCDNANINTLTLYRICMHYDHLWTSQNALIHTRIATLNHASSNCNRLDEAHNTNSPISKRDVCTNGMHSFVHKYCFGRIILCCELRARTRCDRVTNKSRDSCPHKAHKMRTALCRVVGAVLRKVGAHGTTGQISLAKRACVCKMRARIRALTAHVPTLRRV